MSLINQVLQDLDRRHAHGGAVPAAVKALPSSNGGARYWRLAAISAVAVMVVGGGAGVAAWSMGARATQTAAAPVARVLAAAPVQTPVVATLVPTDVATGQRQVTAAPKDAPPEGPVGTLRFAHPAKDFATDLGPAAEATHRSVARSRTATEPAKTSANAPETVVAVATPMAKPALPLAPAAVASQSESRIEKRSPARTAHERAEAEYQRGVAAHQHGQLSEAAAAYAAALKEEASFAPARQALAGVLIGQGRAEDARSLLSDGVALAPQNAALAMTLAHLHVERGELQRAAEVLQPSDLASMSAEDHAFRAAVLQRLNRHAEASEHFAAALRTTPNNGVWWMGLGMSQAADGRNDNAKEAFNRARSSGNLSPELAQYVEQRLRQLL